jgi:prepilin signal peptidase PulO-like enzyme (type II secretory pathway)
MSYLLPGLIGLLLAALVNFLADVLPRREGHGAGGDQADEGQREKNDPGSRGRPPVRYVVVALALAGFSVYLWWREGWTILYGVLLLYISLFALIAVIDIEHRLVLNIVMLPAFVLALVEIIVSGRYSWSHLLEPLAGYAIAQIVVMGIYLFGLVYLWFVNRRRQQKIDEVAFGFGDVTLATFCGLVVGYPKVILMLVLMILLGALFAILYVLGSALFRRGYQAHTALPYGPSILAAATIMLLWGEAVARAFGAN